MSEDRPIYYESYVKHLVAEIELLLTERIELMNWLNTHYPHVAKSFACRERK